MPVMTIVEKAGYDTHVAASGNPHGASLSDLGAPSAALDINSQELRHVLLATGVAASTQKVALGVTHAEANVTVPGDGASHHTFDVALVNSFFGRVEVEVVGIDQTDSTRVYRRVEAMVACAAGTAAILGMQPARDVNAADAGSIFDQDDSPYGDVTVTGANVRITLTAHATHAVKYNVNVKLSTTPFPT